MRPWLLVAAAAFASCDFDAAFQRYCETGRCDGGAGGGAGGDADAGDSGSGGGGGSTGEDGGGDAGADAGVDGGFDGGLPPCPRRSHARLVCSAPRVISPGAVPYGPAASGAPGRFVIAWGTSAGVEIRQVGESGADQWRKTFATVTLPESISVSARDDRWAAAWIDERSDQRVACISGFSDGGLVPASDGGVVTLVATGATDRVGVAVSENGAVGLAASSTVLSTDVYLGASVAGCPTSVRREPLTFYTVDPAAGHMRGGGVDGFRFSVSGRFGSEGHLQLFKLEPDGGVRWRYMRDITRSFGAQAAVMAENGLAMISSLGERLPDGGYRLNALAMSTDFAFVGQTTTVTENVGWWNASTCGLGCVAHVYTSSGNVGYVIASFTGDDFSVTPRGAFHYDVACERPVGASELAVASSGELLAIVVTQPPELELLVCRKPVF